MNLSINVEPLAAAIADRVAELLRAVIHDEIHTLQGEQVSGALQPLATILGVSAAAARMRLIRDPALRNLGLRVGRRLLFRRGDVEALSMARAREASR